MAKVIDLPAIQPFSVADTSSLSQRWEKWKKSLDYYLRASGITDQKQKHAILLHLAGPDVQDIFETLTTLPKITIATTLPLSDTCFGKHFKVCHSPSHP